MLKFGILVFYYVVFIRLMGFWLEREMVKGVA